MEVMTIRKSIRVERPPRLAFRIFYEAIGEWWPKNFSVPAWHAPIVAINAWQFIERAMPDCRRSGCI
jgi:hypothetical protein